MFTLHETLVDLAIEAERTEQTDRQTDSCSKVLCQPWILDRELERLETLEETPYSQTEKRASFEVWLAINEAVTAKL